MQIDKMWVPEGHLLGLRYKLNGAPTTIWWRVAGREYADYPYSFSSTAAGASTGWIDLQDSTNIYILEPKRVNVINHFFFGVGPSSQLLFLQYPFNQDRNALTGNRSVNSTGIGALSGFQTPYRNPSVKTEIFSTVEHRPALNILNNSDQTVTPRLYIYAMQYLVDGPYLAGHQEVGDQAKINDLIDSGKARMASVYGIQLLEAANQIARLVQNQQVIVSSGANTGGAAAPSRATQLDGMGVGMGHTPAGVRFW